jgi:uncharacterized phage protein (TIGR02218 family)
MATSKFITLWKITAKSGAETRACNYEADVTYASQVYTALPLEPTQVQMASGLSPDNAEITIPLVAPFTTTKLLGGFWRGARVVMTSIEYDNLAGTPARRHIGHIGEVTHNNLVLTPQYRSLAQMLNQPVGDTYQKNCRHQLGDEGCKKDLTAFTFTATVTAVTDNQQFTVDEIQADDYFSKGKIIFTSGENDGLEEEIISNDGGDLILFVPMVGTVEVGDEVTLIAGDTKTLEVCRDKFSNAVNFGGFPYLPGRARTFSYPE